MNKKLSILICHLPKREDLLDRLFASLEGDSYAYIDTDLLDEGIHSGYFTDDDNYTWSFDVLIDKSTVDSIGEKRNRLLQRAKGEYVCFIDDDDFVSDKYLEKIFQGIEKGVDCCSLLGEITEDGKNPLLFEHSIKYKEYKTNTPDKPICYERFPNHLNCIKSSIAKQFKFPEKNHGEDTDWATQIFKSGLIKTEHYIPEIIYYYDYRTKK